MPPEKYFITGIPGVKVRHIHEERSEIIVKGDVFIDPCTTRCTHCTGQSYRIKSTKTKKLKHAIFTKKLVVLQLRVSKLYCKLCRRYFTPPLPGTLPGKRATENFRSDVFQMHHGGVSQVQIERTCHISGSTVERWYQDFVKYRVKELSGRKCPIVMGIDEHFFSRKKGYATTLVDLKNHKVFEVVLGRSEASLQAFLKKLPGRSRVRVVVMDLSETYRAIVRKYFPNALIVADRFHVIKLLNHHFLKTWSAFDEVGRKSRGLLSLMRRHAWNLSSEQREKLEQYFAAHPGLKEVWQFKQDLTVLLLKRHQKKSEVKDLIPQFLWHLNELLGSPLPHMKTFGETMKSWSEPIVRMWRFTKNNGITEGLHTKMEMISRRAFGFRNFQNYRLRVIALCGWDGVFAVRS
ncbi:MAG TPA: ISL3 family transposase [Bacteriovoracaceae bacterium]|nr:ISL3 family transposase [Bacteriovoracaceae bacterium]